MALFPSPRLWAALAALVLLPLAAVGQGPRGQKACAACKRRFPTSENFCRFDGKKLLLPPQTPAGVRVAPLGQTAIELSWTAPGGDEAGFVIERRAGGSGRFAPVGRVGGAETRFTDRNLAAGARYTYRVHSVNALGASPHTGEILAATLPNPPAPPAQVAARGLTGGQVLLTWREGSPDGHGFVVERRAADGAFRELARLGRAVFQYTDTGLPEGSIATYRVSAFNTGGASAPSAVASGGPLPNPPGRPAHLIATAVGESTVRLDWTDTTSTETEFRLERRAEGGEFQTVATLRPGMTSTADGGLQPGGRYHYRLAAANAGGASDWTPGATVTTLPQGTPTPASEVTPGPVAAWVAPSRFTSRPGENLKMVFHFDLGGKSGRLVSRWGRFYSTDGKLLRDWVGPYGQPDREASPMDVKEGTQLVFHHQYVIPGVVLDRLQELTSTTVLMTHLFDGRFSDGQRFVCSATLTVDFGNTLEGRRITTVAQPGPPQTRPNARDGAVLVAVNGGGVHRGRDDGPADERPLTPIQLSAGLWAYQREVTNAQYRKFVDATGHREPAFWDDSRVNRPDQPVVGVSWDDAVAYAQWAGGRLPTEAEWEWLARGLDERPYPWGRQAPDPARAVFGGQALQPTGSKPTGANALGILDLAGNAAEWCADWYDPAYYGAATWSNPQGPRMGRQRVVRGGSWEDGPDRLRAGSRAAADPATLSRAIGFRVVLPR